MNPLIVIIPTTGALELRQAVESCLPDADVLLVTDSKEGFDRIDDGLLHGIRTDHCWVLDLPFRVGGGEFAGHRVYAASPHLVNHEFVAFLDEDNWYAPEHLPAMLAALQNADAAWSLRKIVNKDGTFVCNDDCESLGPHVRGVGRRRLVDTSCWAFRRAWLEKHSWVWAGGWGRDGAFTDNVHTLSSGDPECYNWRAATNWGRARVVGTGLYSVNYRLGASERSPKAEFFVTGNRMMKGAEAP